MNQLVRINSPALPALYRNPHTRRAYARAAEKFLGLAGERRPVVDRHGQPVHVATWIEAATRELAG
jgi:integrase/recombinase XerC